VSGVAEPEPWLSTCCVGSIDALYGELFGEHPIFELADLLLT